jgi:cellulose synthase/poly-beta-1,6-N-acetylglucosamine synthase-like glycosyltransferase
MGLWVAIVCAAILVYTYVGYPILVALLAKLFPTRGRRDPGWRPTVTVCIPAYNVERYLGAKLDSLLAQDYPQGKLDIVVYSDASTDGSDAVVERYAATHPRVRLLRAEPRAGKPTALNRMREEARGEVLVLTDSRQPLSTNAVSALVLALSDERVACASGNLKLKGQAGAGFYWRYENWIRKSEGDLRSMVGITGPLYALRRADLPEVPADIILDDMWIPMRLRLTGRRLVLAEDAIAWDEAFEDDREFGRKVRTLAGNFQLFSRMPRLLLPFANPSFFETFSHKILRLLCPWAMLGLLLACVVGLAASAAAAVGPASPELWALRLLLGGQILLVILALVGARGGPLAKVARTFLVLNAAAVVGLWRWAKGNQKVTW